MRVLTKLNKTAMEIKARDLEIKRETHSYRHEKKKDKDKIDNSIYGFRGVNLYG